MFYSYFGILSWVFNRILKPVINAVFKPILQLVLKAVSAVLKWALDFVYTNILKPILIPLLEVFARWVIDFIGELLLKLFYELEIFLLKIVDAISGVFEVLVGMKEVPVTESGVTESKTIMMWFISDSTVKRVAAGIFIVSVLLLLFVSIFSLFKVVLDEDMNGQRYTLSKFGRLILKSFLMMISGPVVVIFIVIFSSVFAQASYDMISKDYSGGGKITYGSAVFCSTIFDIEETDAAEREKIDKVRNSYLYCETGYDYTSGVDKIRANFKKFNIWTCLFGIFIAILVLNSMLKVAYSLIARIMDVVLLMLIQPIFSATIPLDGGEKYKRWSDMIIARVFIANGTFLMFLLTQMVFLPWVANVKLDIGYHENANTLLRIIMILAVITNMTNFSSLAQGLFSYEAATIDTSNQAAMGKITYTIGGYAIGLAKKGIGALASSSKKKDDNNEDE